ncbi:MATE family efflux transporter [Solicola sp. PLA-1-18]|uniref:MATE family efflux transporter n=1 Tax=Solicola sp. PLA-1-18 TaxID=3380532 RepID=UPI003B805F7B
MSRVVSSAAPLYMAMIAASVAAVVDAAVLGNTSTAALAAFALTGVVYFPAIATVTGAVRGVMPFVSSVGDDQAALRRVLGDGTWLSVSIGVVGAAAVASVPLLGRASGVPDATLDALGVFPWLMAGVVVLSSFGAMASSSLVGIGRSTVVMRAGLLGALTTMVLSPLLVLGLGPVPGLGLAGSGLALLVAYVATLSVNLLTLRRSLSFSIVGTLRRLPNVGRVLELAKVGIPMAGTVLVKFGVLGVVALAASRVGTTAAAGHSIATTLVGLTFSASVAVGQAGIPLISERVNIGDLAGVRRAAIAGSIVAGAVVATLCAALVVFDGPVARLFSSDPEVLSLMPSLLPVVAVAIVADGLQAVVGFGLTGLKRTFPGFVISCVFYAVLAVVALPVAQHFGVVGLWGAVAVVNVLLIVGRGVAMWRISAQLESRTAGRGTRA